LALDNVFVIAMIFGFFAVPPHLQHGVLFWGILGVLVLRGVMIGLGAAIVTEFSWVLYAYAAFLILSGVKMLFFADLGRHAADDGLRGHYGALGVANT
jgi:tellurite resistance protein TerC